MSHVSSGRMRSGSDLWRRVVDWGPVGLLIVFGQLDVSFEPALGSSFPGPALPHRIFIVLASLPAAWRRRYPLAVLLATGMIISAWTGLLYPPTEQPPLEAFLLILLTSYSAALNAHDTRRLWLGGVIAALWIPGTILLAVRGGQNPAGAIASWVLVGAVFGFGLMIRRQRRLSRRLEQYARDLEHEREERVALAAALERSRIARELHDVIAHSLSMIVVQAAAERRTLVDPRSSTADVLRTIEDAGRQAMTEMRRLLGVLRRTDEPALQAPQPRLQDLDLLVDQFRASGLLVELCTQGDPRILSPGIELSAYRIVQESLSNVLKHAGSARAKVAIRYEPAQVELEISDDGQGPIPGSAGGHGVVGMRERVALYGGTLEAGPATHGGFRVHAVLPVSEVPR